MRELYVARRIVISEPWSRGLKVRSRERRFHRGEAGAVLGVKQRAQNLLLFIWRKRVEGHDSSLHDGGAEAVHFLQLHGVIDLKRRARGARGGLGISQSDFRPGGETGAGFGRNVNLGRLRLKQRCEDRNETRERKNALRVTPQLK